jgi:dTDP-4-dehydrorhamnose reductase
MQKVLLIGGSGLVGKAIYRSLQNDYHIVITAAHHPVEGGWKLTVEEPERLLSILNQEQPDIVISSVRGDFHAQLYFHEVLADWMSGKNKKLIFISTANVFDGNQSQPWTEKDLPVPESDYGIYKRNCEVMLQKKLPKQYIIFRLALVWDAECPRLNALKESRHTGKPVHTYQGDAVNISYAEQIGWYAKYVLEHDLRGIFHVGTTDTVDYFAFEKMVCKALNIPLPEFDIEIVNDGACQAVIPARQEIPDQLQLTVSEVLQALKKF